MTMQHKKTKTMGFSCLSLNLSETPAPESLSNKGSGPKTSSYIIKRPQRSRFSREISETFRNTFSFFFTEHPDGCLSDQTVFSLEELN